MIEQYRRRVRVAADPLTVAILHACDGWCSIADVARGFPDYPPADVRRAVRELADASLLDRANGRPPRGTEIDSWSSWDPAAGLLHFSSKDLPYNEPSATRVRLTARAREQPMPRVGKRYPRAAAVPLPPPHLDGEFARVVLARRTWRSFAPQPIALDALATLLGLSCAVQYWVPSKGLGRFALKTYPSGGAQHPLEVYVLARRVRGLTPGLYHYASDAHRLERVRRGATTKHIERYLPMQEWYGRAAALLLITAVVPRTAWKYRFPRAYKGVLAEAGHLCQNICLTATWLGLAPFCTMAFADSVIERDLGIDGVNETIVYLAGVGARPSGTDWAPWPTPHQAKRTRGPLARY